MQCKYADCSCRPRPDLSHTRKCPSLEYQRAQLERQGHRCIYCGIEFRAYIIGKKKIATVQLQWDHFLPFWLGETGESNFVASCSRCNYVKRGEIFDSIEQARATILERIKSSTG